MRLLLKIVVIFLLLYLGAGALYGSWMLISKPAGDNFNMTADLLSHSPFRSYLVPGIVLLLVNGLFPLFNIVAVIIRMRYYQWLLIVQGCLLIGWLTIELIISIDFFVPMFHYPLYTTALLLIAAGWIMLRQDSRTRTAGVPVDSL